MTAVVFRFAGFLALISIGASLLAYLVTQHRRWLRFSWQILKYASILLLIVLSFLAVERLVLVA
jgi:hypothetical protein